jgi:hypothetical protein
MTMKKIFRKHPEAVLISLAVVLLAIIGAYVIWSVTDVAGEVNAALNASIAVRPYKGFDLSGAKVLNLKGLVKTQP